MAGYRGSLETRFWAKVEKRGPDECWPWLATKNNHGYGLIWKPGEGRGTNKTLAHRVSYELHCGAIPENRSLYHGTVVMHSCDNPACVNPAHLSLGTQALNTKDMDAKKRRRTVTRGMANLGPPKKGEQHYNAKLTASLVETIRSRSNAGCRYVDLAAEYGLHRSTVRRIALGMSWRHLPPHTAPSTC